MANTQSRTSTSRLPASARPDGDRSEALEPLQDLFDYVHEYTRERPGVVALWCLGVGFVLGWKLKPW